MTFITANNLDAATVKHGFFTSQNGVADSGDLGRNVKHGLSQERSIVEANRLLCLAELELEEAPFVFARLNHGDNVYRVKSGQETEEIDNCDALISNVAGLSIGFSTADCAPVLLSNSTGTVVAAVHLGWRGLANGVLSKTVEILESEYGVRPSELVAAIGPTIAQGNYQIGEEVAELFSPEDVKDTEDGLYLNLISVTIAQLKGCAIESIESTGESTFIDKRFHSYRRDGDESGRQLTVVSARSI